MNEKIDNIYIYIWEEFSTIYVGRTKNPKKRHYQHKTRECDKTYKFSSEHHVEHPPMIILENDLTIEEGVEREKYWIDYYKNNTQYNLLNKLCGGQRGRQRQCNVPLDKTYYQLHREERIAYQKEYNKTHKKERRIHNAKTKEEILLQQKEYYQSHRNEILEKKKIYNKEHREKILAQKRKYRETHKEQILSKSKEYYEANKDKIKTKRQDYFKEYYQTHKEKYNIKKD